MAIEGLYTSTGEDATVRLFVSSTFRDMDAEREELIKRVFPKLRRLCKGRGLAWTDVDLRRKSKSNVASCCQLALLRSNVVGHPSSRCSANDTGGFRASFPKPLSTATLGSLITQQPAL